MKGVDVSEHQGKIDWNKVKENNDFAILRLGWIGNNKNQLDKYFETYYAECKRLGIPTGVYVYNYVKTPERAKECATWVLDMLAEKDLELPVYIDMEDASLIGVGKETLTNICIAFNSEIENRFWAGVYANLNWFNNYLNTNIIKNKYTTWIAHYDVQENKYEGKYDMLQYTSSGSVSGINGRVDLNIMYRDLVEEIENSKSPNKTKFDFLGITKFHELGYKGKGIRIDSREDNKSEHGAMVEDILRQIAPEAEIHLKVNYQKGTDADIYSTSMFSTSDKYSQHIATSKDLYLDDVLLLCAVGNEGDTSQTFLSTQPWWTSIGACDLVKGKPVRMYYSSVTNDLDFMSLTNFTTSKGKFNGTSCATPVFAAMCALLQQFFMCKIGRKLTNYELICFIEEHCIDLQNEGHDDKTGYGLFVLPDPKDIDYEKYIDEEEEEEDMVIYNEMDEIPDWGKEAVRKAVLMEVLKGTGSGLGLTKTELKTIVWFDRLGLLNVPDPKPDQLK